MYVCNYVHDIVSPYSPALKSRSHWRQADKKSCRRRLFVAIAPACKAAVLVAETVRSPSAAEHRQPRRSIFAETGWRPMTGRRARHRADSCTVHSL